MRTESMTAEVNKGITGARKVLTVKSHGFAGVFIAGTTRKNSVIIFCDGAGETEEACVHNGAYLTKTGCSVLILGYHKWPDTPETLSRVPVEYIGAAIQWLKKYLKTDDIRLGICGVSGGALYAMLGAVIYSNSIMAVAAASPFDHLVESVTGFLVRNGHSPFTWLGNELPYTTFDIIEEGTKNKLKLLASAARAKGYGLGRMLRYGYDQLQLDEDSRIPVERMRANVLFLASKDDDCLPAELAVARMEKKLKSCGYPYSIESFIYEEGSHILGGDLDMDSPDGRMAKRMFKAWKKHPAECREAMKQSMERINNFFFRNLVM